MNALLTTAGCGLLIAGSSVLGFGSGHLYGAIFKADKKIAAQTYAIFGAIGAVFMIFNYSLTGEGHRPT